MNRKTFEKLKSMGITFGDDFEQLMVEPTERMRERIISSQEKRKEESEELKKLNAAEIEENKTIKEIYLTFDDGLEAGTEEVLELLKEKNVKGTFFLIGKRVQSMYKRNKDLCFKLLNDIYENHAIGNHSYSHANEFYSSYYREGGVIVKVEGGKKIRRSVVNDFIKAKNTILYYLELAKGNKNPPVSGYTDSKLISKNQKRIVARFPGTNTWYVKNQIVDLTYSNRGNKIYDGVDYIPIRDTKEEARKLGQVYNIFGWDIEWSMNEELRMSKVIRKVIENKINNGTMEYDNIDHIDPFFDLYDEFIEYNRPIGKVEFIKNRIIDLSHPKELKSKDDIVISSKTKKMGKVILLMHELQFRKGKKDENGVVDLNDKSEIEKLGLLIDELKKNNFVFKTLDEY